MKTIGLRHVTSLFQRDGGLKYEPTASITTLTWPCWHAVFIDVCVPLAYYKRTSGISLG